MELETILKNIALALGDGWKADLLSIEKSWRLVGWLKKGHKLLRIEYSEARNKIEVASYYKEYKYLGIGMPDTRVYKKLNISLNRRFKTIAKMINSRVLAGYDEVLEKSIKEMQERKEKEEKKENIINCLKRLYLLKTSYQGDNYFYVKLNNHKNYDIDLKQNIFRPEEFDLSIKDITIDKLFKILAILNE